MEISPRRETNPNPNSLPSPNSSTSSTNSNNNNNNNVNGLQLQAPPTTPTAQPPKPMTRSDPANPYPTTFVQADTNSFKQVVQMLTGSSETANKVACSKHNIPPIKSTPKKQQQHQHQHQHNNNSGFKLYERRNNAFKNQLRLNPLTPIPVFNSNSNSHSGFSPRNPEILSPSILDFPALVLSPVTPLIPDPFDRAGSGSLGHGCSQLNKEAEEKAIKEKGFYLHPSPSTTPRESEPRLLPLFPTTSPRASGSSSS